MQKFKKPTLVERSHVNFKCLSIFRGVYYARFVAKLTNVFTPSIFCNHAPVSDL